MRRFTSRDFKGKALLGKLNEIVDAVSPHVTNGVLTAPTKLTSTVYDDYTVSGLAIGLGASAPTLTAFRGSLYLPVFPGIGATVTQAFFTLHLLHGLKQGTDITFHVHWTHIIASPTGNVKWQIDYSVARGYGVGTYPAASTLSVTQAAGAQYTHHITNDDDMTITTSVELEPDSVIIGRLYRDPADAGDTFANDAYLIQVDVHYQKSHIGTTERNRPWTSTEY